MRAGPHPVHRPGTGLRTHPVRHDKEQDRMTKAQLAHRSSRPPAGREARHRNMAVDQEGAR